MKSNPAFLFSGSECPSTILGRLSPSLTALTPFQSTVDASVLQFVEQASDWRSLTAMTVGGLAYRIGKIGVMSLGTGHVAAMPLRLLSVSVGLGSEVIAFEFTNRLLHTLRAHGRAPLQDQSPVNNHQSPNLWSWSGPGGLKQGLFSSLITFGTLKGFGKLGEGQNPIFQHGTQDLAMVLGHQLVHREGWGPQPEGTFAEQLLHAEMTNLQYGIAMGLAHQITGGRLMVLERGLDLSIRSNEMLLEERSITQKKKSHLLFRSPLFNPLWAFMGMGGIGGGLGKPGKANFPYSESRTQDYHGTLLKVEMVSKKPILDARLVTEKLQDSFLDLIVLGEEGSFLKGKIAQDLRNDRKLRTSILGLNKRVSVQFDLEGHKILSLKVFEGNELKIDLKENTSLMEKESSMEQLGRADNELEMNALRRIEASRGGLPPPQTVEDSRPELEIAKLIEGAMTDFRLASHLCNLARESHEVAISKFRDLDIAESVKMAKETESDFEILFKLARKGNEEALHAITNLNVSGFSEPAKFAQRNSKIMRMLTRLAEVDNESALEVIAEAAKLNLYAVEALLSLANKDVNGAKFRIENLDVTFLIKMAKNIPQAILYLCILAGEGNEASRKIVKESVMVDLSLGDDIILKSLALAGNQHAYDALVLARYLDKDSIYYLRYGAQAGDRRALSDLIFVAKKNLNAVLALQHLAAFGNKEAKNALKNLDITLLKEMAKTKIRFLEILLDLAEMGNESAQKFIQTLDVQIFTQPPIHLRALRTLAKGGNRKALDALSKIKRPEKNSPTPNQPVWIIGGYWNRAMPTQDHLPLTGERTTPGGPQKIAPRGSRINWAMYADSFQKWNFYLPAPLEGAIRVSPGFERFFELGMKPPLK